MTLTIAVTGHRPNRLTGKKPKIEAQCEAALSALKAGLAPDEPAIALTALAEGADRIFARAALAADYRLEAVFPFTEDDYRTTFGSPRSDEYYTLKDKCADIHLMPGNLHESESAYTHLGQLLVEKCDLLFAIWDGKPAAGAGGTTDVIDMAKAAGKAILWIHADGTPGLQIIANDHVGEVQPEELHRFVKR